MVDSDEQLIARVRRGDKVAFEVLYGRHVGVAEYIAANLVDNYSDADDVVAEAFVAVYQHLLAGKGPDTLFRAYLLTVVRRMAFARNRSASKVQARGDLFALDTESFDADPVMGEFESGAVAAAFQSLPERWRAVLWYVDIEGLKPAAVSDILGLSPNAVSSLALRAREGLRKAYLQSHVSDAVAAECEPYAGMLGAYVRDGLRKSAKQRVRSHLESCSKCTAVLADLDDIQGAMRAVVFPMVAGISFTAAGQILAGGGSTLLGSLAPKAMVLLWKAGAAMASVAVVATGATIVLGGALHSASPSPTAEAPVVSAAPTPVLIPSGPVMPSGETGQTAYPVSPQEPRERVNGLPQTEGSAAESVTPLLELFRPRVGAVSRANPSFKPTRPTPSSSSSATRMAEPSATPSPSETATSSATPTPPESATPTATATPSPESHVVATFDAFPGTTASEADLKITFTVAGGGQGPGEVTFSLSEGARIIPGKTIEPAEWKCSAFDVNSHSVRCTTEAVVPGTMEFCLGISRPNESTRLDYRFTGPGIEPFSSSSTF